MLDWLCWDWKARVLKADMGSIETNPCILYEFRKKFLLFIVAISVEQLLFDFILIMRDANIPRIYCHLR